jgi:glycosyltransferase involved in cell wall biosynthesis
MRLLIVEEALKDKRGHWYEYNRAIVAEARRRGIEITVLAHANLQSDVAAELGATPFFPATSWDGVYYHLSAWKRYLGILHHNMLVARLMALFFAKSTRFDVVLVPTVVLHHWLAWRWLAWRGRGRWYGKLVLTTRNNAGEYDAAKRRYVFKSSARVLQRVVASFQEPVRRKEVELATDSEAIAKQYQALCGVAFSVYPHPVDDATPMPTAPSEPSGPLTFGALGPPRFEKGSDLILDAIPIVRRGVGGAQPRFVVQWTGECDDSRGGRVFPSEAISCDPGVTLLMSDLTTAEYQRHLGECDALLLPYRRAQYHARLSGVAVEAFRRGIPCICFSDTWIADAMDRSGSGIAVEEESAEALAAGIERMRSRFDEYSAKAAERAPAASRFHSPQGFVDQLLQVADEDRDHGGR